MAVKVRIPTPLRPVTGGQAEVEGQGSTVLELLHDLDRRFPGIAARIFAEDGSVQRFINIFVNDEDIRFLDGTSTALSERDEVSIIPAIAGGGA